MEPDSTGQIAILLVEDSDGDARLLEEHLEDLELETTLARIRRLNGSLPEGRFDIVLLDLGLPESNGAETVRRFRERDPVTPVVVLTGLEDGEVAMEALRAGAAEYLVKDEVTARALERTLRFVHERHRARQQLRRREAELQSLFDLNPVGIVVSKEEDGTFLEVNRAFARIVGYESEELVGRSAVELGLWASPERRRELIRKMNARGGRLDVEASGIRTRDGTERLVLNSCRKLELGGEERLLWTVQDVTEAVEREEEFRRSEIRYRTLVETMAEATVILDPDGRITFANPAAEELFHLEKSEVTGRTYDDPEWRITAPDGGPFPEHRLPYRRVMDTGEPVWDVGHAIEKPDGSRRILSVNAAPLEREGKEPEGVVATIRDVTEQHRLEKQLRHRALHDTLTGLANRSLFRDRLEQALAQAERRGQTVGLLMLDLNRFKQINDLLGHTAGDLLLEEVARRLEDAVRDEDTVARLGGDEFGVVLPDVQGKSGITAVVRRAEETLARPYRLGGDEVEVDVTAGGVLASSTPDAVAVPASDVGDVLRYADLALHRAKETVGPSFHLYRPDEDDSRAAQLGREQDLRRAIREEEFEIHFQPIVRLDDDGLWALEPLARWSHPERGLLGPGDFIPLAEETGLIHDLGQLLLRTTFRCLAEWPEGISHDVRVTPNLSGRQFDRDGLADRILRIVREAEVDPTRLWFEVTESVITRAVGQIQALRGSGAQLLIDDFGTGYSSFHYLQDLEVDGLKISMPFVQKMTRSDRTRALVETMITMGRVLDMTIVAEGVETGGQRDALRELGCSIAQGFHFARPMPADEVPAWLGDGRRESPGG